MMIACICLCLQYQTVCLLLFLQEVRRAGEHTTPGDALQLLLWHLHGALLTALQQLLQASSNSNSSSNGNVRPSSAGSGPQPRTLSEKGVLQLLFDQRFIRDVLGGGRPLAAVSAAAAHSAVAGSNGQVATANGSVSSDADVAARKRLVSGLEQQLQVRRHT